MRKSTILLASIITISFASCGEADEIKTARDHGKKMGELTCKCDTEEDKSGCVDDMMTQVALAESAMSSAKDAGLEAEAKAAYDEAYEAALKECE